MWTFLAGDALNFGGLLAGYGALRAASSNWPVPSEIFDIGLVGFMTFLLICSSVTMVLSLEAIKSANLRAMRGYLLLTVLGGAIFLLLQAYEWNHLIGEGVTLRGNPFGAALFGTTFFILTGFHGMHVFAGVVYLSTLAIKSRNGGIPPERYHTVEIAGLYWHFVDLVWILIFTFVYLI
jgi:heme/copper-type cytochrome/quinol oxidase subunit 3